MSVASVTILCIVVLLAMFTVGTAFSINMGIIGFIASFIIGNVLMGVDVNTILSGIPTDLFVIIIGVSYFFNILRDNGTIDLIFRCGLKLVRGRVWLMPWIMYALSFLLCGLGTQGTATIVIVAPIALALADRCKISQIMMSVFVAFGMFAGLYSPLNVTGISVGGVMGNAGLPFSFLSLNACMIGFTLGLGLVLYILYGGVKLFKAGKVEIDALAEAGGTDTRITAYQTASLAGLCVLVILGMVLRMNMGFAGMIVGAVLGLMQPKRQHQIVSNIPWHVVLMVCGIVTYIEMMGTIGVMDYLESLITAMDNPLLAALVTSYIGAFISAFVSTIGVITSVVPLAESIFRSPEIWSPGLLACICLSSTIVDICPFSPTGALFVANAQGEEKRDFYKKFLLLSMVFVVVGPIIAWVPLVLIP